MVDTSQKSWGRSLTEQEETDMVYEGKRPPESGRANEKERKHGNQQGIHRLCA